MEVNNYINNITLKNIWINCNLYFCNQTHKPYGHSFDQKIDVKIKNCVHDCVVSVEKYYFKI